MPKLTGSETVWVGSQPLLFHFHFKSFIIPTAFHVIPREVAESMRQ